MNNSFIGSVMSVAFNFVPDGWHACDGTLMPISANAALYSLLGATYGGDGTSTFALPDLRGRVIVGMGAGAGLPVYSIGQRGGSATTQLNINNLPAHTHTTPPVSVNASTMAATTSIAGTSGANTLGATNNDSGPVNVYVNDPNPTITLVTGAAGSTGVTGENVPVSVMQPFLALNYVICIAGIFPQR